MVRVAVSSGHNRFGKRYHRYICLLLQTTTRQLTQWHVSPVTPGHVNDRPAGAWAIMSAVKARAQALSALVPSLRRIQSVVAHGKLGHDLSQMTQ